MMADVLSKANLFSYNNITQLHKDNKETYAVAKGWRLYGFPVKLRLQHTCLSQTSGFHGKTFVLQGNQGRPIKRGFLGSSANAQSGLIGNVQKWWEKGLQPSMKEITSAEDLVDSLLDSGDKLVIVDFFSPGCGGCKALHPKICQLAAMNPNVQFLQVNYEQHKSMCYSLNVHVLPFFRFYRGAHGRLCSFSCTNATIKKFKDALAKHTTDRCSLGPPKGLEEIELLALAGNKDLSFTYTPQPEPVPAREENVPPKPPSQPAPSPHLPRPTKILNSHQQPENKEAELVPVWKMVMRSVFKSETLPVARLLGLEEIKTSR